MLLKAWILVEIKSHIVNRLILDTLRTSDANTDAISCLFWLWGSSASWKGDSPSHKLAYDVRWVEWESHQREWNSEERETKRSQTNNWAQLSSLPMSLTSDSLKQWELALGKNYKYAKIVYNGIEESRQKLRPVTRTNSLPWLPSSSPSAMFFCSLSLHLRHECKTTSRFLGDEWVWAFLL